MTDYKPVVQLQRQGVSHEVFGYHPKMENIRDLYLAERKPFTSKYVRAVNALRIAREKMFVEKYWPTLVEQGKVRLQIVPDEYVDYDTLAGDTYDIELNANTVHGGARTIVAQEKQFKHTIETDGVWGWIVEARCPTCGGWEHINSCSGYVGLGFEDEYRYAQIEAIEKVTGIKHKA